MQQGAQQVNVWLPQFFAAFMVWAAWLKSKLPWQEAQLANLARRVNLQTKMANLNAKYVSQAGGDESTFRAA